jgi:hypothetical protein
LFALVRVLLLSHVDSFVQDRLENYGTVVNIDAYDQMEAASKVLRAKPECGSEPAGTEPASATSA